MRVIEMSDTNGSLFDDVLSSEELEKSRKQKLYETKLNYRIANKERLKEKAKIWFQNNKQRKNEKRKEWRNKNKDKERQYGIERRIRDGARLNKTNKEWREKNRDYVLQKKKEYDKANPDKVRANCLNRRSRLVGAEGSHNGSDISNLFDLQKGKCALCKKSIKKCYHVDHNIPLSRGGSNDKYNLQLLCPPCNLSKHSKDPIEHNQSLGLLL